MQDLELPESLKALYKTVWEIKQRILVDMAADRGAYIDQSQSFNVHMSDPNFGKLTSLHFYGWKVRSTAWQALNQYARGHVYLCQANEACSRCKLRQIRVSRHLFVGQAVEF